MGVNRPGAHHHVKCTAARFRRARGTARKGVMRGGGGGLCEGCGDVGDQAVWPSPDPTRRGRGHQSVTSAAVPAKITDSSAVAAAVAAILGVSRRTVTRSARLPHDLPRLRPSQQVCPRPLPPHQRNHGCRTGRAARGDRSSQLVPAASSTGAPPRYRVAVAAHRQRAARAASATRRAMPSPGRASVVGAQQTQVRLPPSTFDVVAVMWVACTIRAGAAQRPAPSSPPRWVAP